MKAKSFAVIGLGQFGMTLARELANADYDVLAIDDKDEIFRRLRRLLPMRYGQMCVNQIY